MKKILLSVVAVIAVVGGVYYAKVNAPQDIIENIVQNTSNPKVEKVVMEHEYKKSSLTADCNNESKMFCAVDFAVKCTLNPDFEGCRSSRLPKFIFMDDKNVNRPTEISFNVHKIKPISADLVEFHTNSVCNGTWFGLCQGRVIYVLVPDNDGWRVKDVYAIEDKNL